MRLGLDLVRLVLRDNIGRIGLAEPWLEGQRSRSEVGEGLQMARAGLFGQARHAKLRA
jgi:hypothetical protein